MDQYEKILAIKPVSKASKAGIKAADANVGKINLLLRRGKHIFLPFSHATLTQSKK